MFMATRLRERACMHASCRHAEKTPALRAPISSADTLKEQHYESPASGLIRLSRAKFRLPNFTATTCNHRHSCNLYARKPSDVDHYSPDTRFVILSIPAATGKARPCRACSGDISDNRRRGGFGPYSCCGQESQTLLAPLLHLSLFDPLRSTCRHVYPFLS
jgi:hypothetical protein